MDEDLFNKVLKKYLDYHFKDSKWGKSDSNFIGVISKDGVLLAGHPIDDNSVLYTNGEYFTPSWEIFNISPQEFNDYIKKYIELKFDKKFKHAW